jgi:hypothetical protein
MRIGALIPVLFLGISGGDLWSQKTTVAPVFGANLTFNNGEKKEELTSVFFLGRELDVRQEYSTPPGIGFHIGGVVDYKIKEAFSLQSGLLFNIKSFSQKLKYYDPKGVNEEQLGKGWSRVSVDYIEIPIVLSYRLGADGFKIGAGVIPGIAVRGYNKGGLKIGEERHELGYRMRVGTDPSWHQVLPVDISLQLSIGKEFEVSGRPLELSVFVQPSLIYMNPKEESGQIPQMRFINSGIRAAYYFPFSMPFKR